MSKGESKVAVSGGIERRKEALRKTPNTKTSYMQTQFTNSVKGYAIITQET
jgi:hypothetical protein